MIKKILKTLWLSLILICVIYLAFYLYGAVSYHFTPNIPIPEVKEFTYKGQQVRSYDGVFKFNYCEELEWDKTQCRWDYKYLTLE